MRIISDFHDYYDSVQAYGSNPNLIYRRKTETQEFDGSKWPFPDVLKLLWTLPSSDLVHPYLVVICDHAVPIWKIDETWTQDPQIILTILESLAKKGNSLAMSVARGFERECSKKWKYWVTPTMMTRQNLLTICEAFSKIKLPSELLISFASPVIIMTRLGWGNLTRIRVEISPRLEDYEFYRYIDAFTAFQEISMYLGNQLAPPDIAPQTVGDDKVIAASKGFDEMSFRTAPPGRKKENRKANKAKKRGSL